MSMHRRKSDYRYAPDNFCSRCEGCKQIANDDEGTPWYVWAELPPPTNMAVALGLVRPITCPRCGGSGIEIEPVSQER